MKTLLKQLAQTTFRGCSATPIQVLDHVIMGASRPRSRLGREGPLQITLRAPSGAVQDIREYWAGPGSQKEAASLLN